jgi:peroxiredoxin Q/BCP
MKKLFFFLLAIQCGVSLSVFSQSGGIKNGDVAPDFTAKDQNGNTVSLSQLKGKKVVLYFYPKDFSTGCTAEACNLRDNYDSLTKAGYTILGVSTDDQVSHKGFETKYNLPFTLVADVDTSINKQYMAFSCHSPTLALRLFFIYIRYRAAHIACQQMSTVKFRTHRSHFGEIFGAVAIVTSRNGDKMLAPFYLAFKATEIFF